MTSTAADRVLGPLLDADPGAPLVTHYDHASGGRIELSAVSTANWAAKIAGLLRDESGVAPGDVVLLDLPAHWLTPAVLLGAWWAGARVVTPGGGGSGTEPTAVITGAANVDGYDGPAEVLAMSTDPMGRGLEASGVTLPLGVVDLVEACRIHPDAFSSAGGDPAALDGLDLDTLAEGPPTGRVLLPVDPDTDPVPALARLLAAGASIVLVTHPGDSAALERTAATENVTAWL